jgi:hypothetical protein
VTGDNLNPDTTIPKARGVTFRRLFSVAVRMSDADTILFPMGNPERIASENWEEYFDEILVPAVRIWEKNRGTTGAYRDETKKMAESAVLLNFESKPKKGAVEHSNQMGLGLLLFYLVTAPALAAFLLVAFGLQGIPILLITLVPYSIFWIMFTKFSWVSRASSEAKAERDYKESVKRWKASRSWCIEEVSRLWTLRLHLSLARALGVPKRLHVEFAHESLSHENDLRSEWGEEIDDWANQPEFPPAPLAVPEGFSHQEYEEYCCLVLQSWGFLDAKTTRYARDGGIDVESSELVVQCKHYSGSVGVREVREIFGIGAHQAKTAVVFSAGTYTADAKKFANDAGVALFILSEVRGTTKSVNAHAGGLVQRKTFKS